MLADDSMSTHRTWPLVGDHQSSCILNGKPKQALLLADRRNLTYKRVRLAYTGTSFVCALSLDLGTSIMSLHWH